MPGHAQPSIGTAAISTALIKFRESRMTGIMRDHGMVLPRYTVSLYTIFVTGCFLFHELLRSQLLVGKSILGTLQGGRLVGRCTYWGSGCRCRIFCRESQVSIKRYKVTVCICPKAWDLPIVYRIQLSSVFFQRKIKRRRRLISSFVVCDAKFKGCAEILCKGCTPLPK